APVGPRRPAPARRRRPDRGRVVGVPRPRPGGLPIARRALRLDAGRRRWDRRGRARAHLGGRVGGVGVTGPREWRVTAPVFDRTAGQDRAVDVLRRAAERPVHAYLLAGPAGSGLEDVARCLAASLLCPSGGDGTCEVCRRVLLGRHPDSVEIEPEGTYLLR